MLIFAAAKIVNADAAEIGAEAAVDGEQLLGVIAARRGFLALAGARRLVTVTMSVLPDRRIAGEG